MISDISFPYKHHLLINALLQLLPSLILLFLLIDFYTCINLVIGSSVFTGTIINLLGISIIQ